MYKRQEYCYAVNVPGDREIVTHSFAEWAVGDFNRQKETVLCDKLTMCRQSMTSCSPLSGSSQPSTAGLAAISTRLPAPLSLIHISAGSSPRRSYSTHAQGGGLPGAGGSPCGTAYRSWLCSFLRCGSSRRKIWSMFRLTVCNSLNRCFCS